MQSLWMLVASFLFACMGVCVKLMAQEGFGAAEIVFYRGLVALVLMLLIMKARKVALATPHWGAQFKRSFSGFVALALYFWAITVLPLATAVTLNYTAPIFLVILLVLFAGVRLTLGMVMALLLGFVGVLMLLQPSFHADQLWGGIIGLASGILAAVAYYNVRQLGALGEPETRTVFYFSLFSTLGSLLGLLWADMHWPTGYQFALLLGVGGFATLAQLAMTRAYSRGKALVAANLAYTTVVFASVFGVLFWQEHLGLWELLGIALIVLAGIAAGQFSRTQAVKSRA